MNAMIEFRIPIELKLPNEQQLSEEEKLDAVISAAKEKIFRMADRRLLNDHVQTISGDVTWPSEEGA